MQNWLPDFNALGTETKLTDAVQLSKRAIFEVDYHPARAIFEDSFQIVFKKSNIWRTITLYGYPHNQSISVYFVTIFWNMWGTLIFGHIIFLF